MTLTGTIRSVWAPRLPGGDFTVIVRDEESQSRWVLWTKDAWLASLCDQRSQTPRPELTVIFDRRSKQLESVALPVTQKSDARGDGKCHVPPTGSTA